MLTPHVLMMISYMSRNAIENRYYKAEVYVSESKEQIHQLEEDKKISEQVKIYSQRLHPSKMWFILTRTTKWLWTKIKHMKLFERPSKKSLTFPKDI